jgi:PAS domain S-box-containing protein
MNNSIMNTVKSTLSQIIIRKELLLFLVIITAGITLYGWLFDNIVLASFSSKYKPISPIIAVTFIVLSILLFINSKFEKSRLTKSLVTFLFIIITLIYGIVILGDLFNFSNSIENIFVKNANKYGSTLTGYMSPVAAVLCFSICICFLSVRQNYSDIIKYIGGTLALLAVLLSSVLLIAYLYKAPLLFGSQVIPVALPASICFFLLSTTILWIYELKFWTFNLINDNIYVHRLLKSFLPIVVLAVIVQGLLITKLSVRGDNPTLSVALILFIVVTVVISIVVKTSMDIGDKLDRAEEELRESKQIIEGIINTIPTRVFWKDKNLEYLGCNKLFANDAGYDNPMDVIGKDDTQMTWHNQADLYRSDDRQVIDTGIVKLNIEEPQTTPNGNIITLLTNKMPLQNTAGKTIGVLGTYMDITERKYAELKIQQQNIELRKLNADKDRFISILGHDLKSPFNNILGFSEVLTKDIRKLNIDEIEDIAKNINKSAKITNKLLEDILMWARTQQGRIPFNPQNLNLSDTCRNILEILNPGAYAKNITISDSSADHITVYADADMLKTILLNLVSNAIKFTNSGGKITISAEQNSENVTISVSDNGVGIPPENLTKLFDISEVLTTKGTAGETGTGLGLLLCMEFVERHGGKIWVESEEGKGTEFKFSLPIGGILQQ